MANIPRAACADALRRRWSSALDRQQLTVLLQLLHSPSRLGLLARFPCHRLPFGSSRATPWRCLAPGALGRGRGLGHGQGVSPRGAPPRVASTHAVPQIDRQGRAGQGRAGGPSRHAAKARDWPPIAFTRTRTVARRKRNWREKRRKKAFVIDHTRIKCIWRRGHNAAPRPTKMKRSRDRGISANATNTRGTLANAWEAGNNSPLPRLAPTSRLG